LGDAPFWLCLPWRSVPGRCIPEHLAPDLYRRSCHGDDSALLVKQLPSEKADIPPASHNAPAS